MTSTVGPAGQHDQLAELSFGRTVDRSRVHRAAVAEVFITDIRRTGDTRALAGAQLPLTHGYYSDHVQHPMLFDPLLLIECGRQAAICGAHIGDVPLSTAMLVSTFSLRLTNLDVLIAGRIPGELTIDGVFTPEYTKTGRTRKASVVQELYMAGQQIGTHSMEVLLLTPHRHEAVRQLQRGTPAPSTADLDDVPAEHQAEPRLVGRVHPLNVVLSDVTRANGTVSLIAADDGTGAVIERTHVAGVTAEFRRFAELDAPLMASTTVPGPDARSGAACQGGRRSAPPHASPRGHTLSIAFTQEGQTIAEAGLTLVPAR